MFWNREYQPTIAGEVNRIALTGIVFVFALMMAGTGPATAGDTQLSKSAEEDIYRKTGVKGGAIAP